MSKFIIFAVFFFYSSIVFSQKNILLKWNKMEKLDINNTKIKALKQNGNFVESHGDSITVFLLTDDGYQVSQYSETSPYKIKKTFSLDGFLRKENHFFYNVPVGISRSYSEKGDMINEINHDKNPKRLFTIDQLNEKIISLYGINLRAPVIKKNENYSVDFHQSEIPSYTVSIRNGNSYRTVEINSINGETLWEDSGTFRK